MKLMPFFTFYGGKHRAAKHYPPPLHDQIVEPFAGSAGYSLNYADHQVTLRDLDPVITATWGYLVSATADEIHALPDLEAGQSVGDLDISVGAQHLIGWWLNKGSAQPKRTPSTFMLNYPQGGPYWGQRVRDRIAAQLEHIRHWTVGYGPYESVPNREATWFIDPPYRLAGKHYRFGSAGIDYDALGRWCKTREGQVIVCEADEADWLPFRPLVAIDGTEGKQKPNRARIEAIYP